VPPALFICEVIMHPFIYFEQNPMASRTKLFFSSIATSDLCFTSASFAVSFKYQFTKFKVNKNINSASSHQSTTLKSSAHLSLQMLVDLSVAFGGLVLVLFCILVCYVYSHYFRREAPPQRTTACRFHHCRTTCRFTTIYISTTTRSSINHSNSTITTTTTSSSLTERHSHFMKELWQTEP